MIGFCLARVEHVMCSAVLDDWEPEHVRCWAEKLNFAPVTCQFLEAAGVCGYMLNAPRDRVLVALQRCRRRLQAQQQQVPALLAVHRVASQAARLREEAKHIPHGMT